MAAGVACQSLAIRVDNCSGMYEVNDDCALLDSDMDLELVVYVYNSSSGRR